MYTCFHFGMALRAELSTCQCPRPGFLSFPGPGCGLPRLERKQALLELNVRPGTNSQVFVRYGLESPKANNNSHPKLHLYFVQHSQPYTVQVLRGRARGMRRSRPQLVEVQVEEHVPQDSALPPVHGQSPRCTHCTGIGTRNTFRKRAVGPCTCAL